MKLRVFVEPQQGATYDTVLAMAQVVEEEGFDAFFRSDHYLAMGGVDGLPGPTDAWVTLAGLARDTSRVRLGTLVSPATFRLPGPLAIMVAQVDAMSGGRVELGLGAGWYEEEHTAYGIPFPATAERFDRLEEQLAVVTGLWRTPPGEKFSFAGTYHALRDSPALPKPAQEPNPPLIVGGTGKRRTPELAARFADELNVFAGPEQASAQYATAQRACEAVGRDPETLRLSATLTVCCGSDDAEVWRRAAAMGSSVERVRREGAAGTPEEVAEQLAGWREAGASTLYLQVLDLEDLDHVRLIAREVAPRLG